MKCVCVCVLAKECTCECSGTTGGDWCGLPWRQNPIGGKINIFGIKSYFLRQKNEIINPNKRNDSKLLCFCLNSEFSVRGGHCDSWHRLPRSLAAPLGG
jgi:hypothetical protein